jgi:predicted short-subunit dehydrogenase-like oxidoreductase (DUF2520 family)
MKIVLIGSGNVAIHLGPALIKAGHKIIQLAGRTETSTRKLSIRLNCPYTLDPGSITEKADIYILAIKDEAISGYSRYIPGNKALVLHTSGTVKADVLANCGKMYGVLYPVQTFSRKRKINFKKVPLCLEAGTPDSKKRLDSLARSISNNTQWTSYTERQYIHLAAVFANNFSNHLYLIAEKLLLKKDLSFEILRPLILETALKVQKNRPLQMQTGPARRGDTKTIEMHKALLKTDDNLSNMYTILTQSILDHSGPTM